MPVDMFPPINIPVVMVATFYSGMPPQQIEADITDTFERFFTLGSGIDHMESRSMSGVSLIKIYFQPGTDANADVTQISNLAMADLRRLPQGTLPPVVMSMDASSLPVCLLTVEGQGLNETQLHDYLQFSIRNQIAGVPGATVPPPYGGRYRQIMVYVDPLKLQAHQLSPDGCGARHGRVELDPAGGRCPHRTDGLQPLHECAGSRRRRRSTIFRSRPRETSPFSFPMWAKPWMALHCNTTSCA